MSSVQITNFSYTKKMYYTDGQKKRYMQNFR